MTKISNLTSPRSGNPVANQFDIEGATVTIEGKEYKGNAFQSYSSMIVIKTDCGKTFLDNETWNYSATTSKYRNQFLGENTSNVKAKIKSGVYTLANLN